MRFKVLWPLFWKDTRDSWCGHLDIVDSYWEKFSCPLILSCDWALLTDHRGDGDCVVVLDMSAGSDQDDGSRGSRRKICEDGQQHPEAAEEFNSSGYLLLLILCIVFFYRIVRIKAPCRLILHLPILLVYLFREDAIMFKKVGVIFYQGLKLKIKNKWWNVNCSVNMSLNETHNIGNNRHSIIYKMLHKLMFLFQLSYLDKFILSPLYYFPHFLYIN